MEKGQAEAPRCSCSCSGCSSGTAERAGGSAMARSGRLVQLAKPSWMPGMVRRY